MDKYSLNVIGDEDLLKINGGSNDGFWIGVGYLIGIGVKQASRSWAPIRLF